MIKYLVDTNILGYFARNSSATLQKRMLTALKKQEIAISAITRAETRFGLALLQAEDKRRRTIDLLLNEFPVFPWTLEAETSTEKLLHTCSKPDSPLATWTPKSPRMHWRWACPW